MFNYRMHTVHALGHVTGHLISKTCIITFLVIIMSVWDGLQGIIQVNDK